MGLKQAENKGFSFAKVMTNVSNTVVNGVSEMTSALEGVGVAATNAGRDFENGLAAAGQRFVASLVNISKEIDSKLPIFLARGVGVVTSVSEGLLQGLPKLEETAAKLMSYFVEGMKEKTVLEMIDVASGKIVEKLKMSLMLGKDVMSEVGSGIVEAFAEALKGEDLLAAIAPGGWIKEGIKFLGAVAETNKKKVAEFFSKMGESARESFPRVMEAVDGTMSKIGGFVSSMYGTAAEMVENFRNGFESRRELGFGVVADFAGNILVIVGDRLSDTWNVAVESVDNFINGFSSRIKDGFEVARNFSMDVVNTVRDGLTGMRDVGVNMMEGLKEGINSAAWRVADAARNVASNAVEGVRNLLGINSPSRVFAKLGENTIDGYIIGMENKERQLNRTIDGIFDMTGAGVNGKNRDKSKGSTSGEIHYHFAPNSIVIDSKNVKDFNDVIELLSDYAHSNRVFNGV